MVVCFGLLGVEGAVAIAASAACSGSPTQRAVGYNAFACTARYLSAVAMCGMGHADGELAWGRAAGNEGTVFMVPNLNSKGFANIVTNGRVRPDQPLWFQVSSRIIYCTQHWMIVA